MGELDGHRDVKERARRRLALRLLLDWMGGFAGDSWQQRWLASGADAAGRDWPSLVSFRGVNKAYRVTQMTGASSRLILMDAIRPSYAWLFATIAGTLYERFREVRDPAGFTALDVECARTTPRFTPTDQRSAYVQLSRILIHTGGRLADITLDDCVEASRAQQQYQHKNHTHWYPLLRQAGILPETSPPSMLAATRRGQLSIAELVDAQHVACGPIRDLFIDYLSERAPGLDYSSIVALVSKLIRLFWRDLEIHEPGIDSLNLPVEVARRWKQRLSVVGHGKGAGRHREDLQANLMAVRAFYADLTHWALEDPGRWAAWVAPSPVTSRDLAGMGKQRQRSVARRHQRVRELSPVLPQLVTRAETQRRGAIALLDAATSAEAGELFESDGVRMRRLPLARDGRPGVIFGQPLDPQAPRVNITLLEDYAFWAWASIEVLRHTAMRIREMLELTHRSFVAYTLPGTDEVIPLLQVAPSKTDRERLLVVSPELSEALASIIARVRGGTDHIPLVSRYDGAERLHSPALPFLYQRPQGARQQPISTMFI
ncbi:MAG: tyrosine-type recombinase/integrase, partial [Jatrophihabitans sp.]